MVAMFVRLGVGYWRVGGLAEKADPVRDREWQDLFSEACRRIGVRRRPALRSSAAADVPVTCGLFRASVLLPAAASTWSEERRRIVLEHELVHVARRDLLWSCLAQLTVAVHWFNPLAWLAAAQLGKEQERSCDDAVLRLGTSNTVYAEHLVEVARAIALPGTSLPGPALRMADRHDLEQRVEDLLVRGRKRHPVSPASRAAVLGTLAILLLPLAIVRAQRPAPPASLTGSVYDISHAVVPRALVLLHNVDGSNEESTRADAAGVYRFKEIPAGTYDIEVKAPGFSVYRKQGVVLSATAPLTLDFTVPMGTVSDSMEVVGTAPAPSPAPAGTPRRIRVGGNVQATKLIKQVRPAYPPSALAAGVEGTVLLKAVISMKGELLNLTAVSKGTDASLVEAAKDAVAQWRYEPTLLNGQPVEVVTTISVTFRLASESH
jgi:TonB family protein